MIEIENQLPSLGVLWKYSLIVVLAVFTYVIIGSRLLVSLISKFAGEEEVNKPLAIATIECRSLRFIKALSKNPPQNYYPFLVLLIRLILNLV